jgi:hypothetical protein
MASPFNFHLTFAVPYVCEILGSTVAGGGYGARRNMQFGGRHRDAYGDWGVSGGCWVQAPRSARDGNPPPPRQDARARAWTHAKLTPRLSAPTEQEASHQERPISWLAMARF